MRAAVRQKLIAEPSAGSGLSVGRGAIADCSEGEVLRVATYNIHKGVRGMGPARRLEIHNLAAGVASFNADLVFLQEVQRFHHVQARRFAVGQRGWPAQAQADFLAPAGYVASYRTNAVTRQGEHGNALLSRWPLDETLHHDVSDHRFEQRGLLHVRLRCLGAPLHAIVVHLGLIHASRVRQVQRLMSYVAQHVPMHDRLLVAGDFNDWSEQLDPLMHAQGIRRAAVDGLNRPSPTFPSRLPVFALDRIYVRGWRCVGVMVPPGKAWARMSDHLPLLAELVPT